MISIRFEKQGGKVRTFACEGHALFAEEGEDVVCAAVSALSINCANSLLELTEDDVTGEMKDGSLSIRLEEEPSDAASLLMESLILGLTSIEKKYGSEYLQVLIQEVS